MPNSKNKLSIAYEALITSKNIKHDAAQEQAVNLLSQLHNSIITFGDVEKKGFFSKLFSSVSEQEAVKGLYMYGGVGRGKSMLMDLFHDTLPENIKKSRVHFHEFMLRIHMRINELKKQNHDNVIIKVAEQIANESRVLCFDEMQVTDIADAMIIGRLFQTFFEKKVIIVATSNRHPDDLYKDGLQRERFTPFIELFKQNMDVFELVSATDYRLQHIKSLSETYHIHNGKAASTKFTNAAFAEMTKGRAAKSRVLKLNGRKIEVAKSCGDVALFDFMELCAKPLGSEDYLEISRSFTTVIIADIPQMGLEEYNYAIRFIKLIDALYEYKTKLICSAAAAPDKLYIEGDGAFEFARTTSRLIEMQSEKYLKAEHLID